jgi:hypothetical protein
MTSEMRKAIAEAVQRPTMKFVATKSGFADCCQSNVMERVERALLNIAGPKGIQPKSLRQPYRASGFLMRHRAGPEYRAGWHGRQCQTASARAAALTIRRGAGFSAIARRFFASDQSSELD